MDLESSDPVLTCAEAKALEKRILPTETLEWQAMEHAGKRIALAIIDDFREIGGLQSDARVLILCGKGHNGGDALLATRTILSHYSKAEAVVVFCFWINALRPLASRAFEQLKESAANRISILSPEQALSSDQNYSLCLDGIFGFQFRPPMHDVTARLVAQVNSHPGIGIRAAVDLPSGIGEESSPTCFRADFTYATGIVKSPVVAEASGAWVGRLRYLDLGFFVPPAPESKNRVLTQELLEPLARLRSSQSDKRTFGHLCVVGGSRNYPGAVMLAVRAAMRSGVGLITAFVPESLAAVYAAQHPEVMWVGCALNGAGGLSLNSVLIMRDRMKRANALLIGPGLGDDAETLDLVRQIAAEATVSLVLDADALRPEIVKAVLSKPFVCTPHAGEFKRISSVLYANDKFVPSQGALVLKGPLTHVTGGETIYYSPFGGPVLARGGSGDMLAGLIGGLLAQTPEKPLLAACRGVVWHGLAADLLARAHGQVAVENSQLLEQLGPTLTSTHARLIDGATGVHGSERPA